MKRRIFRIVFTLVALFAGAGIVLALSFAGDESKGPVENLMSSVSEVVKKVEEKMIVDQRSVKRSDKLAWLKPYRKNINLLKAPKTMLLGAFDNKTNESFEALTSLEDSLQTTFPLASIYSAWGSKAEEAFPQLQVEAITELGSIPVITWEPWLSDFDEVKFPVGKKVEDRDKNGLQDITAGKYDAYINQWAKQAKKSKTPFFLRLGHEMNDPYRYPWGPHNNAAPDFIAAWQHVHDLFTKAAVNNVVWVWSPHPAYGQFADFYPGDKYVDYVGVGTLNYGTAAIWSKWWTFKDIFGKYYKDLAAFNKPIMITEFGSLAVGGNRADWYAQALRDMPTSYPQVKSILFFHHGEDKTTTQQTLNWQFRNDAAVKKAVISQVAAWPDSLKAKN